MTRSDSSKHSWYVRPLSILSAAFGVAFVAWFTFGPAGAWDSYRLRQQKLSQAEEIRLLEARKQQLGSYLASLRAGDVLALERAARERGLAGLDEIIYDIRVESKKK